MLPMSFNHGWGVRPRSSTFFGLRGRPFEVVTLPPDAPIVQEWSRK